MEVPPLKPDAVKEADKVLRALLRTPKSREGLVAAVVNERITRNFVFGWLAEQVRTGVVVQIPNGKRRSYQIVGEFVAATSYETLYPSWLDPRTLPTATRRRLLLDGREIQILLNQDC